MGKFESSVMDMDCLFCVGAIQKKLKAVAGVSGFTNSGAALSCFL